MSRHLRRILAALLRRARADGAVLWERPAGGGTGVVVRALPERLLPAGAPWPLAAGLAGGGGAGPGSDPWRPLQDAAELARLVPAQLVHHLPAPPQAALPITLPGGRLSLLLLWCGDTPELPRAELETLVQELALEAQDTEQGRRSAEESLRQQEVLNHLEQGVVVLEARRDWAQVNGAAGRLLGLAAGELPAQALRAALEALAGRALNREAIQLEGNPEPQLWRFAAAPTHLKVSWSPIRQPCFRGQLWVLDDISALVQKSEYLEAATAAGIVGIWDWDVPANHLSWDPVMYRLYGRDPGDFGGAYEAWADAIHPEDRARVEGEIQAALRGEREYGPRFRVVWPDGSVHHLQAVCRTSFDGEGRPLRMLGVNYDLTEQAEREQQLAEAQAATAAALRAEAQASALFRQSMRNAAVGQALCDPATGAFLEVNGALCHFLQREEADLLGCSWTQLTHPDDLESDRALGRELRLGRLDSYRIRKRFLQADGAVVWGEVSVSCVRRAEGEVQMLVVQINDITALIDGQEQLRSQRQRLHTTIDSLIDPHVLLQPERDVLGVSVDFRICEANQAALHAAGRSREQLLGRTLLPLLPGLAATGLLKLCIQAVEQSRPLSLDNVPLPWPDRAGRDLYVDIRAVPVAGALSVTWRDVSERQAASEAAAKFELAMRNAAIGMSITAPDGALLEVNPAFCRIMGRDEASLRASTWQAITHPGDLAEDEAHVADLLADRQASYRMTKRFLRPDGETVWVDLSVACIRNPDRSVRYFIAQYTDISEAVRARAALAQQEAEARASSERFQRLLDTMPVGVVCATPEPSPQARALYVNRHFTTLLGYGLAEVATLQQFSERALPDPQRRQEFLERWFAALEGSPSGAPAALPLQVELTCRDGSTRTVELSAISRAEMLVVCLVDVTEQRRIEAERQELRELRERLTLQLTESMPAGTYVARDSGGAAPEFLFASDRFLAIFAITRQQLAADSLELLQRIHPDDRPGHLVAMEHCHRAVAPFRWEGRLLIDGAVRWVQLQSNPRRFADGTLTWNGVAQDITDRKATELALAASEEQYRLLALNMSDVVLHQAEDGTVLWVSPSLTPMLGWAPEEWIGQNGARFLVDGGDSEPYHRHLEQLRRGETVVARDRLRAKDGAIHWVESHISPYRHGDGRHDGLVLTFRTVDREVLAEQQLNHNASCDALTGLFNRREMIERLQRLGGSRRQGDSPAALLFCDIDRFKEINDRLGHLAGDRVLQALAERLQACIRGEDLAARMGGDELVVLLTRVGSLADAQTVAEKIRAAAAQPILLAGEPVAVSLSIGVTLVGTGEDVDAVIARADGGMYRAKRLGRNRVIAIDA